MNEITVYKSVYYQPSANPVFCYRTGLTVYEETLYNGVLCASGWNTAGYPLNVLSNCPTRLDPYGFSEPYSFKLELDGRSAQIGLAFSDFTVNDTENVTEAVLTLKNEACRAEIKIHTVLDGSAMFTRFMEVKNLSDKPVCISALSLISGGLETMERASLTEKTDVSGLYSVGYFDFDSWGREGAFSWHSLSPGGFFTDTRFNADRFRHPLLFIRNNITGKIWFMQTAYSGGCRFSCGLLANGENEKSFLSFSVGAVSGGFDEAVNEMHSHIRKTVLNMTEADPSECLVGAGMGAEHDLSVETTKAFIRQFAEMGAEVFIVDAGWECPPSEGSIDWGGYNGVNIPNLLRYPNGIKEISDYCHEYNMKFGLWVEIERAGDKSPVFSLHPEWRANNLFGEKDGGYLDFTNPEVILWAESELARIITEYNVELLRVDYNVSYRSYVLLNKVESGVMECLTLRHFENVYNMYRRLKKKFPGVIFENCAGGGGRTDLGMMKCFNHTWVSDWQKLPHSALITNGRTAALPPERVDRLFAGMGCHAFGSFDAQMRNTMLTHMTLNVVSPPNTEYNPVQMEFIKHSVSVYKSFIRPFLPNSKVYHHTPEAAKNIDGGVSVLEIASPDFKRGAITLITLTDSGNERFTVYPKGIRADITYKVTLDNSGATFILSGYDILQSGITVYISSSLSSELILFEEN